MLSTVAMTAFAADRPVFDTSVTTIQNLSSYVTVDNNKDGTITIHMPTLSSTTVNIATTYSGYEAADFSLHYGYEKGSGTDMSTVGGSIVDYGWSDHTSFTESDITVDITTGQPRTAIIISGHLASASSCPGDENYWGLMRYTNPTKITYNLNGGKVGDATANQTEYLLSGEDLQTTFNAPTLDHYTFDGWYTQAEGGEKVTKATGAAATYYAHWVGLAEISDGAEQTIDVSSSNDAVFKSAAAIAYFTKLTIDGNEVAAGNYNVTSGSTIVTIKNSYLKTLTNGSHTLSIVSTIGSADTTFTVTNSAPQTGDTSNMALLWIVFSAALVMLVAVICKKKPADD